MSVSNFFPLVLLILSSSPPSIVPDTHCLSELSLSLSSSVCVFTGAVLFHTPPNTSSSNRTALFCGHCSCVVPPSGDANICSPACLKTSGGREILIIAAIWVCVVVACMHDLHDCVSVCIFWFVQSNPDYTHLLASQFRRKRVGEMNTLHMNNRQSDQWFPPGVCCIGRPAAQAAFQSGKNWKHLLSLQEDYTPWVENQLFPHSFSFYLHLCLFFRFPLFSMHVSYVRQDTVLHVCCVGSSCVMCMFSRWLPEQWAEPKQGCGQ